MITVRYVQTMARYNAWQNSGYRKVVREMDMDDLTMDRGAFFGSILGTLNHLLWGDMLWMSRFDGGTAPEVPGIKASTDLCKTPGEWEALRYGTDGRITLWAEGLGDIDLVGPLTWWSGAAGREMTKPLTACIAHFFNHQTHHRGQVHQMLTAAGHRLPDTDLFLMPESA